MQKLPKPIILYLLNFLSLKEYGRFSQINKFFNEILNRDQVKKNLNITLPLYNRVLKKGMEELFKKDGL